MCVCVYVGLFGGKKNILMSACVYVKAPDWPIVLLWHETIWIYYILSSLDETA